MLKQWEDSPGHRENLLMPGAKRVGVAYVDNPKSPYRRFWAMVITD
ncbi:CAP domain-containing protein [Acinetobacter baumannii]